MLSLVEIVEDCEANPVRSREHLWEAGQQAQYNSLAARGRTLYDNLRTKYDVSHGDAFAVALEFHGRKTGF